MVIVNALGVEIGVVRNIELQKLVDLAISQPCLFIGDVEVRIGVPRRLRAVILVVFRHEDIDRHPVFCHVVIGAVPLGAAVDLGGVEVGAQGHRLRHGFAASRIPCGIDAAGVH